MPTIKLPQGSSTLQDQVPGADLQVRSQGDLGNAYGDLGRSIQAIGSHLLEQHVNAQAADFAFSKSNEDKLAIKQFGDKLKLEADPTQPLPDYAEKMQTFIKERADQNFEAAPTERARLSYQSKSEALHTNSVIDAQSYQNKRNAEIYIKNIDAGIDLNQRLMESNPDPGQYKEITQGIDEQITSQEKSQLIDSHVAQAYRDKNHQSIAISILNGLKNQQKFSTALSLLESKNGESDIAKGMTGEQKQHFVDQFKALQVQHFEMGAALINKNIEDMKAVSMSDGQIDPAQMRKTIQAINSNPSIKPEDRMRYKDELITISMADKEINKLKNMSVDQLLKYQPPEDSGKNYNQKNRLAIMSHINSFKNNLIKQINDDPVQAAINKDPQLKSLSIQAKGGDASIAKEYLDKSLAIQKQLNVAAPKVSSKQESEYNAKQLLATNDASAADIILQNLKKQYGERLPMAIDEMAKNKTGVTHDYIVAANMPNQLARTSVIENHINQKSINEAYDKTFAHNKPDIDSEWNKISPDLKKAMIRRTDSPEDLALYNAYAKQVGLEAKKELTINPSLKPKEAIKNAYQKIIGDNYYPVPGARSTVLLPKNIDNLKSDPKLVENFLQAYSSKESLKELDVKIPDKIQSQDWYNQLEPSLRWVSNPSGTGIQLMGNVNGKQIPIINSKDQLIEKSYKEIHLMASKIQDQKVKNDSSFVKFNLMGGF